MKIQATNPAYVIFTPTFRRKGGASYEGKKLRDWTGDDFADYIFKRTGADGDFKFEPTKVFFGLDTSFCNMLEATPRKFQRIYFYGVWEVLKDRFKTGTLVITNADGGIIKSTKY